ncbi:MAG: iron-containing redox enzyme family protein [Candidatus Tectomicrobia bacterium]|nr:iron-containing redox enzyme family protein [Candidatus Tectomicrobia bacterium]
MDTALLHDAFVQELVALRDQYHTKNHPFFDCWVAGKLSKEQMGRYMAQHFQLVREILRPFGVAYAKSPRDVQNFLIENLAEEHGVIGTERGEAEEHDSMILVWTDWCGLSRQDVENTLPLPGLRALLNMMWYLVNQQPWQVWLSAQAVQESQMVGVQQRTIPALVQEYGFQHGANEIHWFEEHFEADQEHGQRAFDMLAKYVDNEALAQSCLRWAEESLKARWIYVSEVEAAYASAESVPMQN